MEQSDYSGGYAFGGRFRSLEEIEDPESVNSDGGTVALPTDDDTPSRPLPSTYPKIMTLDVGGRTFKVSRDTLSSESDYFRCQLSHGFTWKPEADGTYFLDHDPDMFEHLLRFMRRPEIFPLFYSNNAGFDYELYNRLEVEALYFQIDALYEWIKEKKYLQAIVTRTYFDGKHELEDIACSPLLHQTAWPANVVEEKHVMPRTRKVYICPRGIFVHRGDPDKCGAACRKARGDDGLQYEEENYVEVVSVRKVTEFKPEVCRIEMDHPACLGN